LNAVVPALATLFPITLISVDDREMPVNDVFRADVKPTIPPRGSATFSTKENG
jgi:hypothetical protein